MEASLIKVGNSTSLPLAKPILVRAKLKAGDPVELTVLRNGKIVIAPKRRKYTLDELLKGMNRKNWQPLVDWN